ncbi:MAG: helix-turn-helix domain-containing protein [Comamonadaceae bacterium]|nr:MAG: helix-turn-helix domain-containing protein [Comamonadaceae bacterium]
MSIHRLIREGRLRLGMSEQQFADAVGVSRGAVQQWEKPGGTAPKRGNQPRVAEVLGVSIAELLSGGSNTSAGVDARAEVPLVSEVEAGRYTIIDNFRPTGRFETVPVTVPVKRHTHALRVKGDSMLSASGDSFPDGSIVIVEPEIEAVPGDYVIALTESQQTTFKQLVRDGGELYLKPLNARYPIKPLGNSVVVGVVREFTKRFR